MSASDWQQRADARAARVRSTWTQSFLAGALLAGAIGIAALVETPAVRVPALVVAAAAACWGVIAGTWRYMQAVDEQERMANLWGCYVGMTLYLVLSGSRWAAAALGVDVPYAEFFTFCAVMACVLGVYAWLRFR